MLDARQNPTEDVRVGIDHAHQPLQLAAKIHVRREKNLRLLPASLRHAVEDRLANVVALRSLLGVDAPKIVVLSEVDTLVLQLLPHAHL